MRKMMAKRNNEKKDGLNTSKSKIKLIENLKVYSVITYIICAIGITGNNDLNMEVPSQLYVGCIVTTLLFVFFAYYENVLRERRLGEIRRYIKRKEVKERMEAELRAYIASDVDDIEFIDLDEN